MKKRILSLILVMVLSFGLCVPALAVRVETAAVTYRAIKIVINDKEIVPCDEAGNTVEPFIMNSTGTTYLPLRAIAQAFGLNVAWDGASNTVTLTSGGTVKTGAGRPGTSKGSGNVNVTYRDIQVVLDGGKLNLVNSAGSKIEPFILNANSSVYLPLRVIGEALGLSVSWDGATNTASLSGTVGGKAVKSVSLSASDVRGEVGGYFRLEAYVQPEDAVNKNVTWSSTDTDVAAVNSDGIVVLRGAGSAEIVATSINGKTAKCRVSVRGSGSSDPYDESIGYSYSEIKELDGYAAAAAETITTGLEACAEAEKGGHMEALHINTAVSHAVQAGAQLDKALAFLKNGAELKLSEGNYPNLEALASAADSKLDSASKLKADSTNADEVLQQVKAILSDASELMAQFGKATDDLIESFGFVPEPEPETKPEPEPEPEPKPEPEPEPENDMKALAEEYSYLAGTDFRSVRRDYPHATAQGAYVQVFENLDGDLCVLTYVRYKIIDNYEQTTLHNITDNQTIVDPDKYYDKLADRYYGANKIHYWDLSNECLEYEISAGKALVSIMQNGTNTGSGCYVDANTLNLG